LTSKAPDKSKRKPTDDQHSRFVEAARAAGCDEDEATFDEKLDKLAWPKPKKASDRG
jgi:hypothetical protein